ncbi:MAG TPA: hypothetical protein VIF88_14395 [Methylocystis sp.]|jgi:hypothetical protein
MQPTPKAPQILWRKPTGFSGDHCPNCAMGWTRTRAEGDVLTVCLLDREPVLAEMTDCDRYEAKEQEQQP